MHTASYEFLMKPKESAGCHQTLSAQVGSGDETTRQRRYDMVTSPQGVKRPWNVITADKYSFFHS